MSDEIKPAEQSGKPEFTPPATQADLDRIIADRLSRERAKFADYDEIKDKASKFDQGVESQKSELEKLQEQVTALGRDLATSSVEKARLAVVAKHKIDAEYADLLTATTEEDLEAQAVKIAALSAPKEERKGARAPFDPDEGKSPSSGTPEPQPGVPRMAAAFEDAINQK